MFDLEPSIADWRRRMLAAGIKTPAPLEELESHLREEIQRQMKSGLDVRAAFNLAAQNIGGANALRQEFGKIGEVMSARQRKFNIIVCGVAAVLIGLTGVMLLFPSFGKSPDLSFHELLPVSGAFISAALILWSWRFSYICFPPLSARTRMIVAFLCIVLSGVCGVLLLNFTLMSANTFCQVCAAVCWMLIPLALAASIIFALEEAAYRKTATSDL
jgi:cytochrome b subunit of formate dehydrogenase